MPKKQDIPVYQPFTWQSLDGTVEQCHVVIRQHIEEPTVHILSRKKHGQMRTAAYFHKDELDDIINALQAARNYLESFERK
ncbi:MAG: hypothetical protein ACRYFS_06260 [Janthinobacterium lividum]